MVLTWGLSRGRWSCSHLKPWLTACPMASPHDWNLMLALDWELRCSCSLACLHKGSPCGLGFCNMTGGFSEEDFQEQPFQKKPSRRYYDSYDPALEIMQCYLVLLLFISQVYHRVSPDSRGKKLDSTSWWENNQKFAATYNLPYGMSFQLHLW